MDALQIKVAHWQKRWQIPGTTWHLVGYSRSAYRTGFYIAELDLLLDAGPQNFNRPTFVLISHSHIDHIACLPLTMIGDPEGDHQFQLYGPAEAQSRIMAYIHAMFAANALEDCPVESWMTYHPLRGGDLFKVSSKGSELHVQIFQLPHTVPTVGYGISESRPKLRPEFQGRTGKELALLRQTGVEITEPVSQRRMAYLCDCTVDVLEREPEILQYPVIMIECTFLLPEEREMAPLKGHIHWEELLPWVKRFPETTWMLFHFSQRYRDAEISAFFTDVCAREGLSNVHWW